MWRISPGRHIGMNASMKWYPFGYTRRSTHGSKAVEEESMPSCVKEQWTQKERKKPCLVLPRARGACVAHDSL